MKALDTLRRGLSYGAACASVVGVLVAVGAACVVGLALLPPGAALAVASGLLWPGGDEEEDDDQ